MRIHPPKLTIQDTNPFSSDLLGNRKKFGDTLTNLFQKMDKEENLVVLVDAPWGGGKSTFIEMWEKSLKNPQSRGEPNRKPVHLIRFDAFAADHHEDPFIAFSGEVVEFIKVHHDRTLGEKADSLIQSAARIATKLAPPLFGEVAGMLPGGGAVKTLAKAAADIATDALAERIKKYGEERKDIKAFKKNLEEVAARIREKQNFPLVIVVDELDRCRPDFALKLLERIKHLFDVPGVAFLLFAHKAQLGEMIRHAYGREVDANSYLHKFIHLATSMPDGCSSRQASDSANYCRSLAREYELSEDDHLDVDGLGAIIGRANLSLRETERVLAILSVFWARNLLSREDTPLQILLFILVVLKVRHPSLYARIKSDATTTEDILSAIPMKHEDSNLSSETIRFLITSAFSQPETRKKHQLDQEFGPRYRNTNSREFVVKRIRELDTFEVA